MLRNKCYNFARARNELIYEVESCCVLLSPILEAQLNFPTLWFHLGHRTAIVILVCNFFVSLVVNTIHQKRGTWRTCGIKYSNEMILAMQYWISIKIKHRFFKWFHLLDLEYNSLYLKSLAFPEWMSLLFCVVTSLVTCIPVSMGPVFTVFISLDKSFDPKRGRKAAARTAVWQHSCQNHCRSSARVLFLLSVKGEIYESYNSCLLEFLTHALLPLVSCLRRIPQSCGGEEEGSGRGEQVHESAWRWVRRQAHGLAHCAAETSSVAQIERMHIGSWGGQWEGARSGREGGGEGRVLDGRHGGTRLLIFARIADGENGACTHQPESEPKSAQRECRSLVPLLFPFNFCRFLTSLDRQSPNKSLTYV